MRGGEPFSRVLPPETQRTSEKQLLKVKENAYIDQEENPGEEVKNHLGSVHYGLHLSLLSDSFSDPSCSINVYNSTCFEAVIATVESTRT